MKGGQAVGAVCEPPLPKRIYCVTDNYLVQAAV